MRKETIEIFKFEELSEEAQEVARAGYRKSLDEDFSYESDAITESMESTISSKVNNLIDDLKVSWSLNNCQGDGVSFTGSISSDENIIAFLGMVLNRELSKNEVYMTRFIDSIDFVRDAYCHYCHENSVRTDINTCYTIAADAAPRVSNILTMFQQKIEEWRIALCKELENGGYKSIDFYHSNERIDNNIIANDYEFLADGSQH